MLNVAIAVDADTDCGPQAAQVISAACEEVIGDQRCPVAGDLAPGTVAAWYAVVHPNDRAFSSVRIEFRDRAADGVLIESRSLEFSVRDSQKSRLASVGSVIAALAAAREGAPLRARRRATEPSAPLARPAPEEPGASNWGIDVAAVAAPTFGDGPYRLGALASAHLDLGSRAFALIAARYAAHPGNPSFAWYTVSAGVGSRLGERAATFNLEFRGQLVLEHTSVTADRGTERDGFGQNGWGGSMGVDAVWATWRHCSMIFGLDGSLVLPRIDVVVADEDAIHLPSATVGLSLGVRFQP